MAEIIRGGAGGDANNIPLDHKQAGGGQGKYEPPGGAALPQAPKQAESVAQDEGIDAAARFLDEERFAGQQEGVAILGMGDLHPIQQHAAGVNGHGPQPDGQGDIAVQRGREDGEQDQKGGNKKHEIFCLHDCSSFNLTILLHSLEPGSHLAFFLKLFQEYFLHQGANLNNLRVGNAIIDIYSFFSGYFMFWSGISCHNFKSFSSFSPLVHYVEPALCL